MKRILFALLALVGMAAALTAADPPKNVLHAVPFGDGNLLVTYDDGTAAVAAVDFATFELRELSTYAARPAAPPVFRTSWKDATGTRHEIETAVDEADDEEGQARAIRDAFSLHTTLVTLAQEQYPPVQKTSALFLQPRNFAPDEVLEWPSLTLAA